MQIRKIYPSTTDRFLKERQLRELKCEMARLEGELAESKHRMQRILETPEMRELLKTLREKWKREHMPQKESACQEDGQVGQ